MLYNFFLATPLKLPSAYKELLCDMPPFSDIASPSLLTSPPQTLLRDSSPLLTFPRLQLHPR